MIRKRVAQILAILVVMALVGFTGFSFGYYRATVMMPIGNGGQAIMPPEHLMVATASEALATIQELQDKQYEQGYNCLDYAWDVMRLLNWKGIPAVIVRLDLEPDPDHAIVIVPTEDEGWVFIEPQTNSIIHIHTEGH